MINNHENFLVLRVRRKKRFSLEFDLKNGQDIKLTNIFIFKFKNNWRKNKNCEAVTI